MPVDLASFGDDIEAVVVGASGGLGRAFVELLAAHPRVAAVHACARSPLPETPDKVMGLFLDLEDEKSIAEAAEAIARATGGLRLVILATGLLHDGERLQPEKTWRSLNAPAMAAAFQIHCSGPALVAKHFLPLLSRSGKVAFAAVSARVGSIEDNELGGWHAYRASKAALNMVIKTLSIELARRKPEALCVALHPGTVDTRLSKPFQAAVPAGGLFTPEQSAGRLLAVLDSLSPEQTGQFFAWDGQKIAF